MQSVTIDEKTKIPLFTALSLIVILTGAIFWLSTIYALAARATEENTKQDAKLDMLYEIKSDIAVIKEKLIKQGK